MLLLRSSRVIYGPLEDQWEVDFVYIYILVLEVYYPSTE